MRAGIVVLAAGESTRLGEPKQLLTYRGRTLLQHAVETALALDGVPVVVVLGAHAAQIRPSIDGLRVIVAENPTWRDGMGGSVRAGLSALLDAHLKTDAVIFMLCDQPLVSATTLSALIAAHEPTGRAIVASEYRGAFGVPALFAREMFPELLALRGAGGAQEMIRRHRDQAIGIAFPEGTVDIDTPADYHSLNHSA